MKSLSVKVPGRSSSSLLTSSQNSNISSVCFLPIFFFQLNFLAVLCAAKDATDHLNYVGFIESRMRQLTASLERHEAVLCVQTHTKQFKPINLDMFKIGYE